MNIYVTMAVPIARPCSSVRSTLPTHRVEPMRSRCDRAKMRSSATGRKNLIFNSTVVIRRPTEVVLDGTAHSCIGHGCSDNAVGYPGAVSQVVAKLVVDRNAVAVYSVESHPEQGIERHAG